MLRLYLRTIARTSLLAAPLAVPLAAPLACTNFVEGESSTAGLGTTDGSTGETGESTSGTTTAGTSTTTGTGSTSTSTSTGTTATSTTTTTTGSTTGDPTTEPTSTTELTSTDPSSTTEPEPTCEDQTQNGDETDMDCGGGTCPKCVVDKMCVSDSDCESGLCEATCKPTPASCLEIVMADPMAPDGLHQIYPDGSPLQVKCDMTGGGWTCLYANDFAADAQGWSAPLVESCGGNKFLGRITSKGESHREIDLFGVPHMEARVTGSVYVIDTWDNERAFIKLDDNEVWGKTCSIGSCGQKESLCFGGTWDILLPFTGSHAHNAPTVTVQIGTTLNGGPSDESTGLDNVEVCVR